MQFNIGKIINYHDKEGIIITNEGDKYLFLEKDTNMNVNVNDIVIFRPEIVENIKRYNYINAL